MENQNHVVLLSYGTNVSSHNFQAQFPGLTWKLLEPGKPVQNHLEKKMAPLPFPHTVSMHHGGEASRSVGCSLSLFPPLRSSWAFLCLLCSEIWSINDLLESANTCREVVACFAHY